MIRASPPDEIVFGVAVGHAGRVIARMLTSARLLPLRWWLAYAAYVVGMVVIALVWFPSMLTFGIVWVVGYLLVTLAHPDATRRGRKDPRSRRPAG